MRSFWKWTARIVGGLAALALLALSVLYVLSERIVEREYEVEAHAVAVPEDSASVAEGQRLATIRGCYGAAPPLAVVAGYGPGEFARLMETGEPTGDRELGLMKRVAVGRFSHLGDDEVTALYAYLRTRTDALGSQGDGEVAGEAAETGRGAPREASGTGS